MAWLERHWRRITPVSILLLPLSLLFRGASGLRRAAYRARLLPQVKLDVPVIVAGNLTVGGAGKTPLVLWLAEFLKRHGRRPGIVSRGYGGTERGPLAVGPDSDPRRVGDEPVLLARRSGCPVWIGADRARVARALLAAHPECDVILSDDGLQHYGLARDVEIVVRPGEAPGNPWLLPAGPYREPPGRAAAADAVVIHAEEAASPPSDGAGFRMTLESDGFYNVMRPERRRDAAQFRDGRIQAIAGIGRPERFFRLLQRLGIACATRAFPDHHRYRAAELAFPGIDAVLMTEKDAVKCEACADERFWALRVEARVDSALGELVLKKLAA